MFQNSLRIISETLVREMVREVVREAMRCMVQQKSWCEKWCGKRCGTWSYQTMCLPNPVQGLARELCTYITINLNNAIKIIHFAEMRVFLQDFGYDQGMTYCVRGRVGGVWGSRKQLCMPVNIVHALSTCIRVCIIKIQNL